MVNLNPALTGTELTPEVEAQILAKLNEVRELMPFAVGLSSRDRLTYPALGSKGTQFVQRSLESMRQNPSLVPAFVDVASIENSYAMYNNLLGIVESVQQWKGWLPILCMLPVVIRVARLSSFTIRYSAELKLMCLGPRLFSRI